MKPLKLNRDKSAVLSSLLVGDRGFVFNKKTLAKDFYVSTVCNNIACETVIFARDGEGIDYETALYGESHNREDDLSVHHERIVAMVNGGWIPE